jgi:hypothetical protein
MANETLREATTRANPNLLCDILRGLAIGDILTQRVPRIMRAQVPVASDVILAAPLTCDRIQLPTACKASRIRRAWARAGGGTLGEMAIHALNANPGANEIAVAPNGDIVTRHADLYTSLDVEYEPVIGKLITLTNVPVVAATGVCALPTPIIAKHPHLLVSAVSNTGGLVASMTITWRAAAAPASTFACLNLVGTIVYFAVADAVTSCNLTLMVDADVPDPQALLVGDNLTSV